MPSTNEEEEGLSALGGGVDEVKSLTLGESRTSLDFDILWIHRLHEDVLDTVRERFLGDSFVGIRGDIRLSLLKHGLGFLFFFLCGDLRGETGNSPAVMADRGHGNHGRDWLGGGGGGGGGRGGG